VLDIIIHVTVDTPRLLRLIQCR